MRSSCDAFMAATIPAMALIPALLKTADVCGRGGERRGQPALISWTPEVARMLNRSAPRTSNTRQAHGGHAGHSRRRSKLRRCDFARPAIAAGAQDKEADSVLDECEFALGDFDIDGFVVGADLAYLLSTWGVANPPLGDLNNDGSIAAADLAMFLGNWRVSRVTRSCARAKE